MEESFKLLRARVTDVHDVLNRETKLVEQMGVREYHENKAEIETLHDRQDPAQDSLDVLHEGMDFMLQHNHSIMIRYLLERHNLNLKSAIESLQNKDLTSEETTKLYESFLRMLHEDGNEIRAVYTKELEKQLHQCARITKKQIWEQAEYHAEVKDVQATLEEYATENESLKDKIDEQESTITALKDENWTFKLQISSLLYSVRMMEAKVDRLNADFRKPGQASRLNERFIRDCYKHQLTPVAIRTVNPFQTDDCEVTHGFKLNCFHSPNPCSDLAHSF